MAMGIIQFAISLFGNVPCPIIYGAVIDSTCLIWETICDKQGACSLYDPDAFRHFFLGKWYIPIPYVFLHFLLRSFDNCKHALFVSVSHCRHHIGNNVFGIYYGCCCMVQSKSNLYRSRIKSQWSGLFNGEANNHTRINNVDFKSQIDLLISNRN